MYLVSVLKVKSVSALTWKLMSKEEMKEVANIFHQAYEGKLDHIPINPHSKIDESKKLSEGKELKSIFPLSLNQINPPKVNNDPSPGTSPNLYLSKPSIRL